MLKGPFFSLGEIVILPENVNNRPIQDGTASFRHQPLTTCTHPTNINQHTSVFKRLVFIFKQTNFWDETSSLQGWYFCGSALNMDFFNSLVLKMRVCRFPTGSWNEFLWRDKSRKVKKWGTRSETPLAATTKMAPLSTERYFNLELRSSPQMVLSSRSLTLYPVLCFWSCFVGTVLKYAWLVSVCLAYPALSKDSVKPATNVLNRTLESGFFCLLF